MDLSPCVFVSVLYASVGASHGVAVVQYGVVWQFVLRLVLVFVVDWHDVVVGPRACVPCASQIV